MKHFSIRWLALISIFLFGPQLARAATFTNNSRIEISDPTGSLSRNPANGDLTVMCWFRLSIPTGMSIANDMVILVNQSGSTTTNNTHGYQIYYNAASGSIDFTARGSAGLFRQTLIAKPFLDRWYHVAVAMSGGSYFPFLDGSPVTTLGQGSSGNTAVTNGVTIGGWGGGRYFSGDVQEVAIYQANIAQVASRMFQDLQIPPYSSSLVGYYKLGASTNQADLLRNFATNAVAGPGTAIPGLDYIAFQETDRAGEQSLYDSMKNKGADAIVPLSGAFAWAQTAFARPVPGIAVQFDFGYSSALPQSGSGDAFTPRTLSAGWRHSFDIRLIRGESSSVLNLLTWDGASETWDRNLTNTAVYGTRHGEYRGELIKVTDGSDDHEWTTPDRLIFRFRNPDSGNASMNGRLLEIRDFNSNRVQFAWQEADGYVTQMTDSAGGLYLFNYNTSFRLTNITFNSWQVNCDYDANNRLVAKWVTNTSGLYSNVPTRWQFQYLANGALTQIIDPRGNSALTIQYDQYGRQTNQIDALGRGSSTEYNVPSTFQIRRTDPAGFKWIETHDRKGHVIAQSDPLGNITSFTYNKVGNRTSITEPLGWMTSFGYDPRANVIARTNAIGAVTTWAFHPFFNKAIAESNALGWVNNYEYSPSGNLLRHYDAFGNLVSYTYASNGLVLTATDGNGNTTRFAYNTNGFLTATTDPLTNTSSRLVNDVGWPLAGTNAIGEVTTFAYDLNGNLVRTVDSLQRAILRTYDGNGNLTSSSDGLRGPAKRFTTYAYDPANQRTQMVDRASNVWRYVFTARGKVDRTIDPLGSGVTNAYDAANRVILVTDAAGNSVQTGYDANGNATATTDKTGQRWLKFYDSLNRVVTESDPLGNSRRTSYDLIGRVLQTISPNENTTVNVYDGRGRLKKWSDPEGFQWLYDYDGIANITNITDALGGHYIMAYSARSERTLEQNQDGFRWRYEYDPLGRLSRQTDPNGTTRSMVYDPANRVTEVDFNTGRINSFTYDDNNNATALSRAGSGPATLSQLRYDALDRVSEYTDTFGNRIAYSYDAMGRIVTLTYPDGRILTNRFDNLGRLTNQIDWAGRQMTYAFDKADRLISRTYPNGVVQSNAFDNSGRITGLNYRAQGGTNASTVQIALTYAYDRNGNKTAATERGVLNWPLPSLKDEKGRYTASGRLIDRVTTPLDALNPQPSTLNYFYDPSGNMTNASGGGQAYALTYDEDNRVTSFNWDCGLTSKINTNRYDALGRRVARKIDGAEVRFVLDLAGSMERVLCDVSQFGEITAWYVHGPDLCYKVDVTEAVTCYHSDAQANIIAITGPAGTNVARYAYTPYGRSLGEQTLATTRIIGIVQNPYRFSGAQGVMEELPDIYFMRARYYSAEAAVFLSTDPVKHIGMGWQPICYGYANANPTTFIDPGGTFSIFGYDPIKSFQGITGGPLAVTIAASEVAAAGAMTLIALGKTALGGDGTADYQTAILYNLAAVDTLRKAGTEISGGLYQQKSDNAKDYSEQNDRLRNTYTAVQTIEAGAQIVSAVFDIKNGVQSIANNAKIANIHWMVPKATENVVKAAFDVGDGVNDVISTVRDLVGTISDKATTQTSGSGGDGKHSTLSTATVRAASVATSVNVLGSIKPSGPMCSVGTTSTGGSSTATTSSGGSTGFSRVVSGIQSATQRVGSQITSAVQRVTTAVSTTVSRAVSWVRRWF
jgi:RHS repeat-associated protein